MTSSVSDAKEQLSIRRGIMRLPIEKIYPVISIILGLAIWEFVGQVILPRSLFFVPFSDVILAEVKLFTSGVIWRHLWVSGSELAIGFVLGSLVGIGIGAVMGISRTTYSFLNPWVAVIYATPLVATAPLYILIFGIDIASKAALVFTVVVFPVLVNTMAGFRNAETRYTELARSFGGTPPKIVRKILFPSAVPYILTGLKLSSGRGIVAVVVGEFFISRAGIGFLIAEASQTFRIANLFAGVLILALSGLLLFRFFEWLERRIAPWKE